jgi:hypothetical protein
VHDLTFGKPPLGFVACYLSILDWRHRLPYLMHKQPYVNLNKPHCFLWRKSGEIKISILARTQQPFPHPLVLRHLRKLKLQSRAV